MLFYKDTKLNKRVAQGLRKALGVVLVLSLLCALFFVASEACHECGGEDCPVCVYLEECVNTIKGFCDSLPVLSAVLAAFTAVILCSLAVSEELVLSTLITAKVRMNN
ncbi:MAG: hypothetical protein J5626_01875 [Lachnospiraceae bacterium]|nr:hypothetical protein [Lachnospiraceae bacterium]